MPRSEKGHECGLREHPLSAAFPDQPKPPIDQTRRTVVLHEGQVIWGWQHVVTAKRRGGERLVFIGLGNLDPVEFAVDKHCAEDMPIGEKVRAIARCAIWLPPGRPSRFQVGKGAKSETMTARAIADYAGVSVRSVVRAKNLLRREMAEQPEQTPEERIAELEEELDDLRLVVQDYANRALPPSELSELLSQALAQASNYRRQWRAERGKALRLKGQLKIRKRLIKKYIEEHEDASQEV